MSLFWSGVFVSWVVYIKSTGPEKTVLMMEFLWVWSGCTPEFLSRRPATYRIYPELLSWYWCGWLVISSSLLQLISLVSTSAATLSVPLSPSFSTLVVHSRCWLHGLAGCSLLRNTRYFLQIWQDCHPRVDMLKVLLYPRVPLVCRLLLGCHCTCF